MVGALLSHPDAAIRFSGKGRGFKLEYGTLSDGTFSVTSKRTRPHPYGWIQVAHAFSSQDEYTGDAIGRCYNGYYVQQVYAKSGWGPLLYELALEIVSQRDAGWSSAGKAGLTSDRVDVSDDAQSVWANYSNRSDVEEMQMDIDGVNTMREKFYWLDLENLTPDDFTDDCNQTKSIVHADGEWSQSPLSRMYHKPSTEYLDQLEAAGRLIR
jgi:hypothetical protein